MEQIISVQPRSGLHKIVRIAGMTLIGTSIAALMIAWAAFLVWLAAEAAIIFAHWL